MLSIPVKLLETVCVTDLFLVYSVVHAAPINETVEQRLKMGEKPNCLIHEKSPYLLQHAFNPVDWYPWSDEAFAKAKAEDKPVFLSIGYSTCHWCHVMAHESFDNQHIAELLNKWFICIKVDREERPDIDQMYMSATQAMTGGGGWPMSVFLFPDGKPFYAGTYFPPSSMHGRPGFEDIITSLHNAWLEKRSDLESYASQLIKEIEKSGQSSKGSAISDNILQMGFENFKKNYEPTYGGFGYAPKFPRPVVFNFLLRYWSKTNNVQARDMVLSTLKYMARGGVYDQIGGGFHRYATDPGWREPHFEKMLYDQSQLAESYLDAFLITRDRIYADVADEIFTYVLREMTDLGEGFYSAEDADSEDPYNPGSHSEGAYYLWTESDIVHVLDKQDARVFTYSYGVKPNGNAPEDPQGEFKGKNILYLAHTLQEAAEHFKINEEDVVKSLKSSRERLLKLRSNREKPHLDDKIITAWNGLMIGALARGSQVLRKNELLAAAVKAAEFIKTELYSVKDFNLIRIYRQGRSGLPGQLDDYAYLIKGIIELYQATQNPEWLAWAVELTEKQIELFWDVKNGGFFDSVSDESVPVRMKGQYDGAEPAGNSIAASNLFILGSLTGNVQWQNIARETVESFGTMLNRYPEVLPQMLCAFDQISGKSEQVVIAGVPGREDTLAMQKTVHAFFSPDRIVLLADGGDNQRYLAEKLSFLETVEMIDGKATAYICQNYTCQLPVNDIKRLRLQLEEELLSKKKLL